MTDIYLHFGCAHYLRLALALIAIDLRHHREEKGRGTSVTKAPLGSVFQRHGVAVFGSVEGENLAAHAVERGFGQANGHNFRPRRQPQPPRAAVVVALLLLSSTGCVQSNGASHSGLKKRHHSNRTVNP